MRYFILLGSLIVAIAIMGCKGGGPSKSPLGYEFTHHIKKGGVTPQPGEYVYFHAYMRNGDSLVVSSREMGQTPYLQIPSAEDELKTLFPVGDVLRMLSVGDSATVAIRIDTIPQKPTGFENADVIYYDIAVTEILNEEAFQAKQKAEQEKTAALVNEKMTIAQNSREQYYANSLGDQVKTTASGLKYVILEEGSGAMPTAGSMVSVHYIGMLKDGNIFDQSFERGSPIDFPLGQGQVIKGWDEGIALLKEGSRATFFIPANLGYGTEGSPPVIPANAELVFYVELVKAN